MTPEERLEKVEELIAERDEITAQLLELMGEVGEEEEVEEEEEAAPRQKKQQKAHAPTNAKGCTESGSPSRHKKTCSKAGMTATSKTRASKTERFVPTEEMTPVGITRSNRRTILDKPLRLTEQEFKEVQEAIIDGLTLTQVGFSYPQGHRQSRL